MGNTFKYPTPPTPRAQARPAQGPGPLLGGEGGWALGVGGVGFLAVFHFFKMCLKMWTGRAWALGVGGVGYLGIWGNQTLFQKMSNTGFQHTKMSKSSLSASQIRVSGIPKCQGSGFKNVELSRLLVFEMTNLGV